LLARADEVIEVGNARRSAPEDSGTHAMNAQTAKIIGDALTIG
jgi:hypothetical protein